ncbi:hypothetical protein IEQ44_02530 [Nocardioides sp. Y6]|uniref:HNH endonuclease n=1 Tax=Nocardioides malaquae TaxID=2773426 RepID=A0ABR9RPN1_9ACTN|nr:hypothetical protein [Nocardioides malaquae]MBE7323530.1 hypothetical protein [Nocardioides malaquae]
MILRPEELIRTHQQLRLAEAELVRRDRRLTVGRVGRAAERAALRARLAVARAL